MPRGIRSIALVCVAGLCLLNCGCATLEWLWDVEQRKNQWLRETFLGRPPANRIVPSFTYDAAYPCDNPVAGSPGAPPATVTLQPPAP
jgi:hypothetical protein